jgi:hypothetical protein
MASMPSLRPLPKMYYIDEPTSLSGAMMTFRPLTDCLGEPSASKINLFPAVYVLASW